MTSTFGKISLELAMRLKKLGVRQERAEFYWGQYNSERIIEGRSFWMRRMGPDNFDQQCGKALLAAFTCAELGVALPPYTVFPIQYKSGVWWHDVGPGCTPDGLACEGHNNEADARGLMLEYLLLKKIITVESVNERLAS